MTYDELVATYGAFTAHNFRLAEAEGGYTLGRDISTDDAKIFRVIQLASDLLGGLEGKRVLDIACLEGIYSVELARRGALVTAIDIRQANIEKARYAARAFGVEDRIDFVQADILDVEPGEFDLVLCLGIFYHFDRAATFRFAEKVAAWVKPQGTLVLDTFFSTFPHSIYRHGGEAYYGNPWVEHLPWTSAERKKQKLWQSLTYNTAVYLTRASIERLFANLGFTTFCEVAVPGEGRKHFQRTTFVGIKGTPVSGETSAGIDRADRSIRESNILARLLGLFAR